MQIRNWLNPNTHLRLAYRGISIILFVLLAVPLVTQVLPILGPLLVVGSIAYYAYRRSAGWKRPHGERRNAAGAERTPIMPQDGGGA